ncbi:MULTISPECIES: antibiotic biosynthesis monooxygenase [Nostoc]|uniref:Antibiotic biosynthesis monooxygenase n=1 Tax=Nostoc paludosum FACHB-159 TaxID=2692908 RepID=A0ABR8K1Y4_9NOSO|nr:MULTISPECIES: antibiotic biosynthesis monooxygenase [Nostoc]MBD2678311.1 antibiotic biosynthesis monooxygenase [Nostoc sp. FACHB-857]MBD2733429.1 antibiotic biosynthesis monooxygenase [Nostoc paludosum FACHB-159]
MNDPKFTEHHVTAVITHLVKPGREEGYEEWMRGIIPVAKTFDGHLGVNILRPEKNLHPEYIIVLHFDNQKNLQAWLDSDVRHEWIERAKPLIQTSENVQVVTGLETWFVLPRQPPKLPPKRYKMVLLSWLAVFVTLSTVRYFLKSLLAYLPELLGQIIIIGIVVCLLTYVVMPQLTRLFYKWLYPNS